MPTKKKQFTFAEHKEATAVDCETIAKLIQKVAAKARDGNIRAFEEFWISDGTEEGDAQINALRELAVLRFQYREENLIK